MATFNSIKQKLIDRVYNLAPSASAADTNFLAKALDQIESNPKDLYLGRVNIENAELNEGGLDRERATQSTSTSAISPLGGGIHREQQTRSDGEMGIYTNYENSKGQRDESKIIKGVDRDFSQLLNFTYNHTCFHEDLISINSSVYLTLNKLQN